MFLERISKNINRFRQNIVLGIFLFLVLVPSFFSGEWSKWLQSVIYVVVFLLVVYIVILAPLSKNRLLTGKNRSFSNPNFYLLVFLTVVLITSFFSISKYNSFSLLFLLASYIAIYFSAYYFFRRWQPVKIIANAILAVGVMASIIALVMYLSQSSDRAMGLFFNANALGSYLLFSLPLGIVLFFWHRKTKWKFIYFFSSLVVLSVFLLTYSFSGWFSFIIPLAVLIGLYRRLIFRRRNLVVFLIVILVGFLGLSFFRYQNSHNLGEAVKVYQAISFEHGIYSLTQRFYFNQSALEIFKDNPLLGSGYNTFQYAYGRYYRTIFEQPRYAHDYYLQTAAEVGIAGFLALMAFIIIVFKKAFLVLKRETDEEKKNYLFGLFLGLLGSAIHAGFDFGWQFPATFILFWLIAGLFMARDKRQQEEIAEERVSRQGRVLFKIGKLVAIVVSLIIFLRGITLPIANYYFGKAQSAIVNGDPHEMVFSYQNGLKYDPDPIKLINYVQERIKYYQYLKKGDFQEYESRLQRNISINKEDYYAHWVLGRVYFVQDKYEAAEREYKEAIRYNPVFRPDFYYDLAFLYFRQEKYDQAKDVILSILKYYPEGIKTSNPNLPTQLAFLNILLGDIYKEGGNTTRAKYFYQIALRLKPNLNLVNNKIKELQ